MWGLQSSIVSGREQQKKEAIPTILPFHGKGTNHTLYV
jgi:hypothetical protein